MAAKWYAQNFVSIYCQIKQFSIQKLDFDQSVWMPAIVYSGPTSAVSSNEQFSYIQTDWRTWLNRVGGVKSRDFIRSLSFFSRNYIVGITHAKIKRIHTLYIMFQ